MEIEYKRMTGGREGLRAEAVIVELTGEGRGVARINRFYRRASEAFLRHVEGLHLPEGRYTARLGTSAECREGVLTVRLSWSLRRRSMVLTEACAVQQWQISRGMLLLSAEDGALS